MRRAAVQGMRIAHRGILGPRFRTHHPTKHALRQSLRLIAFKQVPDIPPPLHSSMYIRNLSLALVSTIVATTAYYAYRDAPSFLSADNSASPFPSSQSSTDPRRALVVDNENFYTGTLHPNAPLSKLTDDAGRKILEMLTPSQVTDRLRKNEESYHVSRGRGVVRYDVVQIPSNDPIEDDHVEKIVPSPSNTSSDWMFWGVFDGHSGWTTSAKLRSVLISYVAHHLSPLYKSTDPPSPTAIDAALKQSFLALDHEIIHASVEKVLKANTKRVAAELLAPALSGSCALLSFYDTQTSLLRVACTGDSRAVLGRRSTSSPEKWTATPLSVDQTGGNEDEADRLRREHPGEEYVVRNGRILGGLEPSRAFGDSFYKWSRETQERIKTSFFGRTPSQLLQTPPYVTAEPVITTTKIEPELGDFVVMATDGLWEMLTNEEVVGLVGQWLDAQPPESSPHAASHAQGQADLAKGWLKSWFGGGGLPVEGDPDARDDKGGQRTPIRQRQWGIPVGKKENGDERFTVEDKNVATHLVRNALGGRDRDMVSALLTLPSPYARRYRDDLTVEVIFFGSPSSRNVTTSPLSVSGNQGGDETGVAVNKEASASKAGGDGVREGELKAKL